MGDGVTAPPGRLAFRSFAPARGYSNDYTGLRDHTYNVVSCPS